MKRSETRHRNMLPSSDGRVYGIKSLRYLSQNNVMTRSPGNDFGFFKLVKAPLDSYIHDFLLRWVTEGVPENLIPRNVNPWKQTCMMEVDDRTFGSSSVRLRLKPWCLVALIGELNGFPHRLLRAKVSAFETHWARLLCGLALSYSTWELAAFLSHPSLFVQTAPPGNDSLIGSYGNSIRCVGFGYKGRAASAKSLTGIAFLSLLRVSLHDFDDDSANKDSRLSL